MKIARVVSLILPLMVPLSAPAIAGTLDAGQKNEVSEIVRTLLKSDPSIIRSALAAMQAQDAELRQENLRGAIVKNMQNLLSTKGDPFVGNINGSVVVVEFYDPRCPYCKSMLPNIEGFVARNPDIKVVFKDVPILGAPSVLESRAILAAKEQGSYSKMQSALMTDPSLPSEESIRGKAKSLGLDEAKLLADMHGPIVSAELEKNLALQRELGIDGTPSFVIGKHLISGLVDSPRLEAAVALARSEGAN